MRQDRASVGAEGSLKVALPRWRWRDLSRFLLASAGAVLVTLLLSATASAAEVGVVSVSCAAPHGCPVTKPAVWIPDRLPEMGYGLEFKSIRWRGWGGPTAHGRATAVTCPDGGPSDGSDCTESGASVVVYDEGWALVGTQHVYRCLWIRRIGPSLMAHVPTDISAYDTLGGGVHCRART